MPVVGVLAERLRVHVVAREPRAVSFRVGSTHRIYWDHRTPEFFAGFCEVHREEDYDHLMQRLLERLRLWRAQQYQRPTDNIVLRAIKEGPYAHRGSAS